MKLKSRRSISLGLLSTLLISTSGRGGTTEVEKENCKIVINAQGPSFLKVINKLNTGLDLEFVGITFGALMDTSACELFGLPTGNYRVDFNKHLTAARNA